MEMRRSQSLENLNLLAHSSKIHVKESYFRLGANISEPMFVQVYNINLGSETYGKLLLKQNGKCCLTTCPTGTLLGIEDWRAWHMGQHLYIAYDKRAKAENKWWMSLLQKAKPCDAKTPKMYGDLVVFRHADGVVWNEKELRRELLNYLVLRYRCGLTYGFDFSSIQSPTNGRVE